MRVHIVTTAHWAGDPRLNRHAHYLENAGVEVSIVTPAAENPRRWRRLVAALRHIRSHRPDVVILPDPEMFVTGSILARILGVRAVIDIHENYAQAAASRTWVPGPLRPLLRFAAHVNDRAGRGVAHGTIVAAQELATPGAALVENIPDPASIPAQPARAPATVVYIGDVTEARGALEMAALAAKLPDIRFLVIGPMSAELRIEMNRRAAGGGNLILTGRLPHAEAWEMAQGSIAGLSLLAAVPAYMEAVATKLWEYCAAGIPPVVSNLPGQRRFAERIDGRLIADSPDDAAGIIEALEADGSWRDDVSTVARRLAAEAWRSSRPDLSLLHAIIPDRSQGA